MSDNYSWPIVKHRDEKMLTYVGFSQNGIVDRMVQFDIRSSGSFGYFDPAMIMPHCNFRRCH